MKKTIFLIAALIFTNTIYAQESPNSIVENPRIKRPLGLSLNLGGPTFIASASVDYFVLPLLNVEAGGGIYGYYLSSKYHFQGYAKREKTTLYAGLSLIAMPPYASDGRSSSSDKWLSPYQQKTLYGVYIPVGFNTIYKNGYTFSIEIAYSSIIKEVTSFPMWFSLKWGYHFKSS
jgi:hypothetical protein